MSDPLLFVAADPREFNGWISHWDDVRPISCVNATANWGRTGKWKGRPVKAIANGAGPERAFAAVVLAGAVSAVCNIGFCGAADENLGIGDITVATEVRSGDVRWVAADPGGPECARVIVESLDHVAQTALEKRTVRATGASIVEMEAAGIAQAAEDFGIPFYCVRAVSDLANEDFANDFNAAITIDGRFSAFRLVAGALADPIARFGELMRLQKRAALASKKLGEFLADCNF